MNRLEYAFHTGIEPRSAFAEVLHAGYERCAPRHRAAIPRDHHLLHLVLAGTGVLKTDGATYHLSSHQCFLIRPGQQHQYQADANNPWEYIWLGFAGVDDAVLEHVYGIPSSSAAFVPSSPTRLEFQMRRILSALQSENPLEQLYAHALAVLALGCIGERVRTGSEASGRPDYVAEAVSFIESNYASIKNVQSVVDYVGLDRSYFSKLFQDRTGVSVARFLAETRMSHAKRLLVDTDYRVKSVAEMVGYDKYQSFERRFTALVGMSPSEFRNRPAGERLKAGWYSAHNDSIHRTISSAPTITAGRSGASVEDSAQTVGTAQVAELVSAVESSGSDGAKLRRQTAESLSSLFAGTRGCPSRVRRRSG